MKVIDKVVTNIAGLLERDPNSEQTAILKRIQTMLTEQKAVSEGKNKSVAAPKKRSAAAGKKVSVVGRKRVEAKAANQ